VLKDDPTKMAYVVFNAYTNKPGKYRLDFMEGSFTIFNK
jgi:hypothetical protein